MILVTYCIPYEGDCNIFCNTIEEVRKAVKAAKSCGEYYEIFVVSEISLDEAEDMFTQAEKHE